MYLDDLFIHNAIAPLDRHILPAVIDNASHPVTDDGYFISNNGKIPVTNCTTSASLLLQFDIVMSGGVFVFTG